MRLFLWFSNTVCSFPVFLMFAFVSFRNRSNKDMKGKDKLQQKLQSWFFFFFLAAKTRVLWTDFVLTMIILGGLLTIFVIGTVDSGGMSAVVQKAKIQDHFQRDSFSFRPTHQVIKLYRVFKQVLSYTPGTSTLHTFPHQIYPIFNYTPTFHYTPTLQYTPTHHYTPTLNNIPTLNYTPTLHILPDSYTPPLHTLHTLPLHLLHFNNPTLHTLQHSIHSYTPYTPYTPTLLTLKHSIHSPIPYTIPFLYTPHSIHSNVNVSKLARTPCTCKACRQNQQSLKLMKSKRHLLLLLLSRILTYLLSLDTIFSGLLFLPVFTHLVMKEKLAAAKCPTVFAWPSFTLPSFCYFCQPFSWLA